MNKTIEFLINKKNSGERLDVFLSSKISNLTRSYIKKLIEKNKVRLNKIINASPSTKLKTNDNNIWFGQLYGMSDNISFNLASNNYNTFKILPFGSVNNLMPYLIRRAEENTSVQGQTGRELQLILKERKRRSLL